MRRGAPAAGGLRPARRGGRAPAPAALRTGADHPGSHASPRKNALCVGSKLAAPAWLLQMQAQIPGRAQVAPDRGCAVCRCRRASFESRFPALSVITLAPQTLCVPGQQGAPLTCPSALLRQRKLDEVERLRARERGQEAERQLKQRKLLRLEAAPKASRPGAPGLPPVCQPVRALQWPDNAQLSWHPVLSIHRFCKVTAVVHV